MASISTSLSSLASRAGATKYNGGVLTSGKYVALVPTSMTTFNVIELGPSRDASTFATVATVTISTLKDVPRWNAVVGHDGSYIVLAYVCADNSVRCRIIRYTAGTGASYVSTDAESVAYPATANIIPDVMDLDVSIGGAVVVGFLYTSTVAGDNMGVITRVRYTTSPAWAAAGKHTLWAPNDGTAWAWRSWVSEITVAWSQGGGATARRFDVFCAVGSSVTDVGVKWVHCSVNETNGASFSFVNKTPGLYENIGYGRIAYGSGSYGFSNRPRTMRAIALAGGMVTALAIKALDRPPPNQSQLYGTEKEYFPSHFVGTVRTTVLGANAAADTVSISMVQALVTRNSYGSTYAYGSASGIGFHMHPDGSPTFNFLDQYHGDYYNPPGAGGISDEYYGEQVAVKIVNPTGSFTLVAESVGAIEPRITGRPKNGGELADYWMTTQAPGTYTNTLQDWMAADRYQGGAGANLIVIGNAKSKIQLTNLAPSWGSVVATSSPTVQVTLADLEGERNGPLGQRSFRPVYTIANNNTLTTSPVKFTAPATPVGMNPIPTPAVTWGGAPIASGSSRWVGVQLLDPFGNTTPVEIINAFTISHPSTVSSVNPAFSASSPGPVFYSDPNSQGYSLHTVSWVFSDAYADDTQSAYRVVTTDPNGTVVDDTGKITSAVKYALIKIPFAYRNTNLTYTVYTWDMYGESAAPGTSARGSIISYAGPNITNITIAPLSGSDLNAANPQVRVTHTPGFRQSVRLSISISRGGEVLRTMGIDNPANLSVIQFPSFLQNDTNYTVTATVTDEGGLSHALTANLHTLWAPPSAPTGVSVSTANYNVNGFNSVDISWSNSAKDTNWIEWTIYRQINQVDVDTQAVLAYGPLEYLTSVQTDAPTITYSDRTAPSGVQVGYVVRQKVNRSGSLVESVNVTPTTILPASEGYWLLDPSQTDPAYSSFQLYNVVADSYVAKYESEIVHIIGRGNHEDRGDYLGIEGSLTAKLRNGGGTSARQKKLRIEAIRGEARRLILRTPFGDMFYVSVGDITVDRVAGQGLNEFVDVTIPYNEVYR